MQRLWPFLYLLGAVLCTYGGYVSLSPDRTASTNADWIFVTLTFVISSFFPLLAMAYSRRRGVETFRRPSLTRQPLGWWTDTLQPLRVSLASMALYLIGACVALPKTNQHGVMLFWFYGAFVGGLFIGERLVYRLYATRIVG